MRRSVAKTPLLLVQLAILALLHFVMARRAHQENAGAEVRVIEAELIAAFEIVFGDNVGFQQPVPLKIGEGFEENARVMRDPEPGGLGVARERFARVGTVVPMRGLGRGDGFVMRDQPHFYRNLPRRRIGIGAHQKQTAVVAQPFIVDAREHADGVEVLIRFTPAAPEVHVYSYVMRPREIENTQFPWTFQRQLYDCLHDFVVEMFVRNPQREN